MQQDDLNSDFRKNKFIVPDNYFENFESKVLDRVYRKNRVKGFEFYMKKWAIAASIAIVAVSTWLVFRKGPEERPDLGNITVNQSELIDFQSDIEVNDDEFIDLLDKQVLDSLGSIEVMAVSNVVLPENEIQNIREEYSLVDDEIEI